MTPPSTLFWRVVGRKLVDFFGGRVDYCSCDDVEWDYIIPAKTNEENCPDDGPKLTAFQERMLQIQPLVFDDLKGYWVELTMSKRCFVKITPAELCTKIHDACSVQDEDADLSRIFDACKGDFEVSFSCDTFYYKEDPSDGEGPCFLGIKTLSNGLTCWGMVAGGDWESPVFFIVYFDGDRLRVYIPTLGNPWNTNTKRAYGNDKEADWEDANDRIWPELKGKSENDGSVAELVDFSEKAIKQDILSRFELKAPSVVVKDEDSVQQQLKALSARILVLEGMQNKPPDEYDYIIHY